MEGVLYNYKPNIFENTGVHGDPYVPMQEAEQPPNPSDYNAAHQQGHKMFYRIFSLHYLHLAIV